jgi:sigma-B regulation protein RsbU (phosphoserine phosphatase)
LFFAAPKYGLLVAVIALVPFGLYVLDPGIPWLLPAASALASCTLFLMVYFFFMTIGSVEYDNEVKTGRLAKAYHDLRLYAQYIRNDLRRARDIQDKMLPDAGNMPLSDRVEWAHRFIPAIEVGGDYFDVQALGEDRVAILLCDVSGHGMAAAFVTAIVKTTFQSWLDNPASSKQFVHEVNSHLCRLTPDESFAAVFFAVYDARAGCLTYINGGHNPEPLLMPRDGHKTIRSLSAARGMVLGVVDGLDVPEAQEQLAPGDTLVFVTDGIVEAHNPEDQMYGTDRLKGQMLRHHNASAQSLVDDVVTDVGEFVGSSKQADDYTLLALKVR